MNSQKCRTCLKSNTKTFPLTKSVTGCTSDVTYAKLLKEYAKFEFNTDYESHLPQHLCFLCCSQLKSTYTFIQQAHHCHAKLINILSKEFCLREQVIDLPQQQCEALESAKEENPDNHVDSEDEDLHSLISNEDVSDHDNNLGKNESFIAETNLTTDQIIEYDIDDNSVTNESFTAEPVPITEQIIEYDSDISVELDNNDLYTEAVENDIVLNSNEEVSIITEIEALDSAEALDSEESLLESAASFQPLSTLKSSSKEQTFTCEKCSDTFNNKYEHLKHIKEEHNNDQVKNIESSLDQQNSTNKTFPCRFCNHIARTASGLKYHHRAKHPTEYKTHKCNFCSYTTTVNKYNLFEHIKTVHKELIRTLRLKAINNTDESTVPNINNNDNDNLSANDLNTAAKDEGNIVDNDKQQNKEELNDEAFIRNMLNMKIRKAATGDLVRRCEECGKIYSNYKCLLAHINEVHKNKDKLWQCHYCDKKCKRKDGLKYHIRNAHGPEENRPQAKPRSKEKRFMCAECSYTCTTSTVLNIHIRVHHTGERPYKCDICSKSFVVAHDLKQHRYTHTGEKPYKCSVCFKNFRDPSHMRRHMRLHTNKNPFTCDDCGKSFTQSYNLSVHKRTHLKEKNLDCSVCGKVFKNNTMLNIHQINENHYDEVA